MDEHREEREELDAIQREDEDDAREQTMTWEQSQAWFEELWFDRHGGA